MPRTSHEVQDGVLIITLTREDALNAIDDAMNAELATHWERLERDDSVDLAILTGAGRSFSVGADLKSFLPQWSDATALEIRRRSVVGLGGGLTRGRHRLAKPVIAAVNGAAVGGGLELALACDIRIASEAASFGVFEIRMGIHPGDGGLVRMSAICGMGVAMDLAMTGRKVEAEEALRLGLVSRVTPAEALMDAALDYAQMIRANGQSAVQSVKETLLDIHGLSFDAALKLEGQYGYSSPGDYADLMRRVAAFTNRKNS